MTKNIKSIVKTTPSNAKHFEENNLEASNRNSMNSNVLNKLKVDENKHNNKFPK